MQVSEQVGGRRKCATPSLTCCISRWPQTKGFLSLLVEGPLSKMLLAYFPMLAMEEELLAS